VVDYVLALRDTRGELAVSALRRRVLSCSVGRVPDPCLRAFRRRRHRDAGADRAARASVTGVYRYVRNPMYLAVTAALGGQALLFGQLWLLAYAAIFLLVTVCFVRWYEEPTLERQFPVQYRAYRSAVPRWWPRRHPWTAASG
jgi:protein-S-isoprenylcysteine O-methyltransferase Ste14